MHDNVPGFPEKGFRAPSSTSYLIKKKKKKKAHTRLHFARYHHKTVPKELFPRNRLYQTQKELSSSVSLVHFDEMMAALS